MLTFEAKLLRSVGLSFRAMAVGAFCVAGCAGGDLDDAEDQAQSSPGTLQETSSQTTLPNPTGAYFAEVRANGTGCPQHSWVTRISSDGLAFTTTFSKYETSVNEKTQLSVKDCTLSIELHSPSGLSYTVTDFYYEGYAALEAGVQGLQTASYYFQGVGTLVTEKREEMVGPIDRSYLFKDTVRVNDRVWSPCGVDRLLNVKTLLRLTNSNPRRNGIINLSSVNSSTSSKIVIKLGFRRCEIQPASTDTVTGTSSSGSKQGS